MAASFNFETVGDLEDFLGATFDSIYDAGDFVDAFDGEIHVNELDTSFEFGAENDDDMSRDFLDFVEAETLNTGDEDRTDDLEEAFGVDADATDEGDEFDFRSWFSDVLDDMYFEDRRGNFGRSGIYENAQTFGDVLQVEFGQGMVMTRIDSALDIASQSFGELSSFFG